MNAKQLRSSLDKLELNQIQAARLLGVYQRTMRRWVAGDSEIPETAAILVRLLLKGRITIEDIESVSG